MTDQFDPTEAVEDTRDRAGFVRTAGWATALNAGRQFFTLAIGFVLAGLLGPDAYGVLAMALVYIAFLEMLQRQGLIGAVIQRQDLDSNHANAAFWLVMATSTVLTLVSVALSGWWADANRVPELRPVIIALSLTLPLQGLNVVQEALLRRQMRFRALTIRTTSAVLAGGVAGVAAAVAGWAVWALVAQQLVTALWSTVALWVVSGWRPGLHFTRESVADLFSFSAGTLLSSLGLFLNARADVLISGLFLGPVTVGLYRFAARLIDAVISLSGQSASSMALPELSPFKDDRVEFVRRIKRLSKMSGALAIPALGVMFGAADVIIATLGPDWAAASDGLRWLCVYGVIRAIVTLPGPILMALGRTFTLALFSWGMAVVSVVIYTATALLVTSSDEATQVAAVSASRAVVFGAVLLATYLVILSRLVGMGPRAALTPFGSSLIAGLVGAAIAALLTWVLPAAQHPILVSIVACGTAAFIAYVMLTVVDPGARQMLMSMGRRIRSAT